MPLIRDHERTHVEMLLSELPDLPLSDHPIEETLAILLRAQTHTNYLLALIALRLSERP